MSIVDLAGVTDARQWALEFNNARAARLLIDGFDIAEDEGTMLAWFANAIEAGRMAGPNPSSDILVQLRKLSDAEVREVGMRISQAVNRYRRHRGLPPT